MSVARNLSFMYSGCCSSSTRFRLSVLVGFDSVVEASSAFFDALLMKQLSHCGFLDAA